MRTPLTTKTPSIAPKKAFAKINNTKLIKNALLNVSLPGELSKREREDVYKVIDSGDATSNYIVLFKGVLGRTDYRALYRFDEVGERAVKVCGAATAPDVITDNMVNSFFKYNSGAKEYSMLGT